MGAGVENTRPGGENTGSEDTTDFGFRRVRKGEKAPLVRAVFDGVADRYDLMNDLMSMGVHRAWKRALIDWLDPRPGMQIIDVAGGTGDIAFRFLARLDRAAQQRPRDGAGRAGAGADAIVCDMNESMIRVGRARAIDRGLLHRIDWLCGNAEALPLADMSMDAFTIAFGLRNVTDVSRALAEARRVLRPGGRFLCLEFSQVVVPLLAEAYERYSFDILPWLGQVVTGRGDAYRYLVESIRRFPDQDTLAGLIADAGLGQVTYRNLTGGVAALHSAWRI